MELVIKSFESAVYRFEGGSGGGSKPPPYAGNVIGDSGGGCVIYKPCPSGFYPDGRCLD